MKAKLKASVVPDGIELIAGKWYGVLDMECHGEKGKFGEAKKVLIQSEKKRNPEWYKAEYFILAADAAQPYCHSNDGEFYHGEFETEQEAIADAKESYPGESEVYIGTCTKPVLRWYSNEEEIVESIIENLSEDVGEVAESFEVSQDQERELAKMIDETVKTWIEKEKIEPPCYQVMDVHMVSVRKEGENENLQ